MKRKLLFIAGLIYLLGCTSESKEKQSFSVKDIVVTNYDSFGSEVTSENIIQVQQLTNTYKNFKQGDTIDIAFSSIVNDVCKAKGCWMKLKTSHAEEVMVKFKDYSFFVPKDIEKDTVIVQGKAYISETSVEELRHLASDAGKSKEEIDAIIAPRKTYSLIADGVLIKK